MSLMAHVTTDEVVYCVGFASCTTSHSETRMPKRTNEKQQIIEMLKTLGVPEGSRVYRSRMLPHSRMRKRREVDVVVEHDVDGRTVTLSFEVVGRRRKATVEWVEQMIEKHRHMPTDTLHLVSWSGFTADALVLARAEPTVVPIIVTRTGGSASLTSQELFLDLSWIEFSLLLPDGTLTEFEVSPASLASTQILASDGAPQGTAWQLGTWLTRQPDIFQPALAGIAGNPRGHEIGWILLRMEASHLPPDLWLSPKGAGGPLRVAGLRMAIGAAYKEQRLMLEVRRFRDEHFGHATMKIGGEPTLLVATMDPDLEIEKLGVEGLASGTRKNAS